MSESIDRAAPVFVTGHRGLVGSAILRQLAHAGFSQLLTATRSQLDLRDAAAVEAWFAEHQPQYVVHVAGRVGGIHANATQPADFLYDNLMIHATVMRSAHRHRVRKLLYLGSSCIYPREAPQPIPESALLTGPLEPTNDAYALAKIAGVKACEAYRHQYECNYVAALPSNVYGPHDHFGTDQAHVLASLVHRFHEVREKGEREVTVWGTGTPRREFLYVDDLADACLFLLDRYNGPQPINVGVGKDISIDQLASLIRDVVHPDAVIQYDTSRPDGTPRKLLDTSRLTALGWKPRTGLREGIEKTYQWFLQNRVE